MTKKAGNKRDAFTFSLGGLTTIAAFVPAPAVAHDQIRQSHTRRGRRTAEENAAEERHPENESANAA